MTKSLAELRKDLPEQLNEAQLAFLQNKTPQAFIKFREGRGGGNYPYVEVGYVQSQLNRIFGFGGWDWEYQLVEALSFPHTKQIVINGTLTVRVFRDGELQAVIKKTASGGGTIKYPKGGTEPIDLADDMKSASADALKKAASYLGIAADVYYPKVYAAIEALKKKAGLAPAPTANEVADEDIESAEQQITADQQKGMHNQLLRQIFAAANKIHKDNLDTTWIGKTEAQRKEEIKTALAKNGLIINSFSAASIVDLQKAVKLLSGEGLLDPDET